MDGFFDGILRTVREFFDGSLRILGELDDDERAWLGHVLFDPEAPSDEPR